MKRSKEEDSVSEISKGVLELEKILKDISRTLLNRYAKGGGKIDLHKPKTFNLKVYRDSTLTDTTIIETIDRKTVYLCPTQYHLLHELHTNVLTKRVGAGITFLFNGYWTYCEYRHLSLEETEKSVLEWKISINYIEHNNQIVLNYKA